MKVLSKCEFNKLSVDSLFKGGRTITENKALPYCTGKYDKSIIGSEIQVSDDVRAVFAVAKSDRNGTYYQLRFAE